MSRLRVESTRGGAVESVHLVSLAVTDLDGRLLADAGNPALVTFWRSGAKPFQAMPLVEDGGADRFGLGEEELALACASHSSEPKHLEVASRFLARIGQPESALACGPHPPISAAVAEMVARTGQVLTPRWSNCSGNHAGMLALALHHGWPAEGYARWGHPGQDRIAAVIARWSGLAPAEILHGVDGCTAVSFGLPLYSMATAYARFGASKEAAPTRLRHAMMNHPFLVAGTGRFCTESMSAMPGEIISKVGAEGVYSVALPNQGVGIALKVEDGDGHCAPVALYGVLRAVLPVLGVDIGPLAPLVTRGAEPIVNTRGEVTGVLRCAGAPRFVV